MIERGADSTTSVDETPPIPSQNVLQRKCKKTRRGRKKKLRYEDANVSLSTSVEQDNEEAANEEPRKVAPYELPDRNASKNAKNNKSNKSGKSKKQRNGRSCILRPLDVPQAPKNSTQFIIDDHEDSNLYFSFEVTPQCRSRGVSTCEDEPPGSPLAGFQDIDYEYESPDDLDTTAFYEQDFENIYRRAREDELLTVPKEHILDQYLELEERVLQLESQLSRRDPALMVARLQAELLLLQEENGVLRQQNIRLKGLGLDGIADISGISEISDISDIPGMDGIQVSSDESPDEDDVGNLQTVLVEVQDVEDAGMVTSANVDDAAEESSTNASDEESVSSSLPAPSVVSASGRSVAALGE